MLVQTFLTLLIFSNVNTLNILVYSPSFANSHMIFMGQLADTLTDAGHNVTLLIPVADRSRRNASNTKTTKDIVYVDHDKEAERLIVPVDENVAPAWKYNLEAENLKEVGVWFANLMESTCANLLRHATIFDEMRAKRFDVAILEPLTMCGPCFVKKLGIEKFILASSVTFLEFLLPFIGEVDETSYVPTFYSPHSDEMSFFERYDNYKWSKCLAESMEIMFDMEEAVVKTHFNDESISWRELLSEASLYFTNSIPYIDFPRPTCQKTVPIGGISVNTKQIRGEQLSEEWQNVLNLRQKTMLISFGSMAKSIHMPIEWRDNILKVIESFPDVTFIWKYESEDTKWAEHVKNVHFSQWVPQKGLLADQRVTAFLTHAGLGSTNEILYFGKPALLVPILGDQMRNANMLARQGGSIKLDKFDLENFEKLKSGVDNILSNETYRKTAENLARLLEDQPNDPRRQVVRNVEFVAKHGPFPKMDPYVRRLNYIQRTHLDIFMFLYGLPTLVVLLITTFIVSKFFC